MIGTLTLALAVVAGAVILIAVSIRVGILLGRRLDRVLEARMSADPNLPLSVDTGASSELGNFEQEENRRD